MQKRKAIPFYIAVLALFLFLLVLNVMTPLCVDDFTYLYNFADGSPMESPFQIVSSMKVHAEKMNGRLFSHGLDQFFLLMPALLFDAINSLFFVFLILYIYVMAKGHRISSPLDPLGFLATFAAVWVFTPAFGEVILWQTGACGYLWAMCFSFLFLIPFMQFFQKGQAVGKRTLQILFVLFSFPAGGYLENSSAAMIGMAVLFLAAGILIAKRRPPFYLILALLFSVCGYLFMLTRPAELMNKAAFTWSALRAGLHTALLMYREFLFPFLLFFALLGLAVYEKRDGKRLLTALIFLIGSLASNFIMSFASYYPARCAAIPAVLLLLADAILVHDVFAPLLQHRRGKNAVTAVLVLSLLLALYPLGFGTKDIVTTGLAMRDADKLLQEAAENGKQEVYLPILHSETKYGVLFELKYLDTDPETWPNHDMAKFHGLDAVIGININKN